MSSEPYVPSEVELAKNATIRNRRVVALTRDERLRGITKIKADTLREAQSLLSADGYCCPALDEKVDQIEREARDGR